MDIDTWLTSQVDYSTHSVYMDKPSWGPINRETIQKKLRLHYGYIEFVTTSGTFNLNFMENHDFNDLGKAVTKILDFMCSDGPVGWVGAQRCLERDLESSRSILRSETV